MQNNCCCPPDLQVRLCYDFPPGGHHVIVGAAEVEAGGAGGAWKIDLFYLQKNSREIVCSSPLVGAKAWSVSLANCSRGVRERLENKIILKVAL